MLNKDRLPDALKEIERLNALVETLRAANASFEGGMHWRNGLITELADALSQSAWPPYLSVYVENVLQRAREAVK